MIKTLLKLSLVSVLLIASQACTPGISTPAPHSDSVTIIRTMTALAQTLEPGVPITGPSSTPMPRTTPASALSPTSTLTPAPGAPQVSVSQPTNCRAGPSTAYDRSGGLPAGQVAEVVGRSADGTYWVIRNPDRAGELCWLWGQFATVTGNTGALPVYTPPPLPTPSLTPVPSIPAATSSPTATPLSAAAFIASYTGIQSCAGTGWWAEIELKNSGAIPLQSMALTVTDPATSTTLPLHTDNFTNKTGCNAPDTRPNLPAGAILTVSSPVFNYDPRGHQLSAVIKLCSNAGQGGTCTTQTINFTP